MTLGIQQSLSRAVSAFALLVCFSEFDDFLDGSDATLSSNEVSAAVGWYEQCTVTQSSNKSYLLGSTGTLTPPLVG